MRTSRILPVLLLLALLGPSGANACTLWSLSGQDVAGGGAILVKNRDFTPDHPNHFALITPRRGYRMAAMVSTNPEGRAQVVGGVNEKGLAVVTATVGTIGRAERRARSRERGLQGAALAILTRCATVEEALADKSGLARLAPVFALLADARGTAVLECSGTGCAALALEPGAQGTHANHPLLPDAPGDIRPRPDAPGSVVRLERIRELLAKAPKPLTLDAAAAFARDAAAGPDQSIFRAGSSPERPRTLGMLAVWLPPDGGAPVLAARTNNPGEPEAERRIVLDQAFWRGAPAPGGSLPLLGGPPAP